jgi:tRNA pseudouridine55 synthase
VSTERPSKETIDDTVARFTGKITQTPPAYSAIKINGQRAYKLARKGTAVEIPTRQVTIHSLEVIDYTYPNLTIRTHVSSGTYIRSLAEDIGESLGTGAYCAQLRRTTIGALDLADAKQLASIAFST